MKRGAKAIGLAVGAGCLYMFLVALTTMVNDPFVYSGAPIPMGFGTILFLSLVTGLVYGAVLGLACSPVALCCLRKKNLVRAVKIVFCGLAPVSVALAYTEAPTPSGTGAPNPWTGEWIGVTFVPLFHLLSLVLWRSLPNLSAPPGFCQSCDYNLTGNVSGVCPECGKVVERKAR